MITCNPIVNALAHADRYWDACNLLEIFPLYGPFNLLVLGYCKYRDLAEASSVFKEMMGRRILLTADN
jgi:pentatricopeptide repeat protein